MMAPMLDIQDLHVSLTALEKNLVQGISLRVYPGEVHVIMGPNGAGKSSLAKFLAGHPAYRLTHGLVQFLGQDLLALAPERRALQGLFLGFQDPVEVPGVQLKKYFKTVLNAKRKAQSLPLLSEADCQKVLQAKLSLLGLPEEILLRDLNAGFSGGEKKRCEILQMAIMDPKLALLDETDSGLDIDAMKTVGQGIASCMDAQKAFLIITHYPRLLEYLEPTNVHVMMHGRLVLSGQKELARTIEDRGYDWIARQ